MRVWDTQRVYVCFGEVAAFDVWTEGEGLEGGLDGLGVLDWGRGFRWKRVDWFDLGEGNVHCSFDLQEMKKREEEVR